MQVGKWKGLLPLIPLQATFYFIFAIANSITSKTFNFKAVSNLVAHNEATNICLKKL